MELKRNEMVVFENGYKAGYLEAIWSESRKAFWITTDEYDENGEKTGRFIKLYSTTVVEKLTRKSRKFVPSETTCTVKIIPLGESEKSYQIEDGSNGLIGKKCRVFYKYIAKSICYVDGEGNIYAPAWAM